MVVEWTTNRTHIATHTQIRTPPFFPFRRYRRIRSVSGLFLVLPFANPIDDVRYRCELRKRATRRVVVVVVVVDSHSQPLFVAVSLNNRDDHKQARTPTTTNTRTCLEERRFLDPKIALRSTQAPHLNFFSPKHAFLRVNVLFFFCYMS